MLIKVKIDNGDIFFNELVQYYEYHQEEISAKKKNQQKKNTLLKNFLCVTFLNLKFWSFSIINDNWSVSKCTSIPFIIPNIIIFILFNLYSILQKYKHKMSF